MVLFDGEEVKVTIPKFLINNNMTNKFYVYELIDPRTNRVFYVGKGCDDRAKQHLTEASRDQKYWVNTIKCQIINNIIRTGLEVIVRYVDKNLDEDSAYGLEELLVSQHGKIIDGSGILSNIADGGIGGNGQVRPVVQYTPTGAVVSSFMSLTEAATHVGIHKSTICAALNGRTHLAGGYLWSYVGDVPALPPAKGVPVIQYDLDGNKIKQFKNITTAAKTINIIPTAIVDICRHRGPAHTLGGYRWSYVGEDPRQLPKGYTFRSKERKLKGVCVETNATVFFDSVKEAVDNTPANATGISDCHAGRKKTSGGFRWRWIAL